MFACSQQDKRRRHRISIGQRLLSHIPAAAARLLCALFGLSGELCTSPHQDNIMHASKVIASTAAAISLIGAIGFAYAQSSSTDTTRSTTNPQTGTQTSPPATMNTDPSMRNQPQTRSTDGTGNTSANSRDMSGERMARSDRN